MLTQTKNHTHLIVKIWIIILFSFYLVTLLFSINNYPLYEDEGISVLAAEGIIKFGYPQLPSGMIYERSPLYHYLLAGQILVFGKSEFAVRAINIALALCSLFILFKIVLIKNTITAGIATLLFLIFSPIEMAQALSARMYILYQLLTLFSAFCLIRGFIYKPQNNYKLLFYISSLLMLLSHTLAAFTICSMGIVILYFTKAKIIRTYSFWIWSGLIIILCYFLFFLDSPAFVSRTTLHSDDPLPFIRFSDITIKSIFVTLWFCFKHYSLIVSLILFVPGLITAFLKKDRQLITLYFIFLFPLLCQSFFHYKDTRFIVNLYPLFICILAISFDNLSGYVHDMLKNKNIGKYISKLRKKIALFISLLINNSKIIIFIILLSFSLPDKLVIFPFKSPEPNAKPAHEYLRQNIQQDDILITSNPWLTYYYLENFDYFIRQKKTTDNKWTSFSAVRDSFFAKTIIDSPAELKNLLNSASTKKVWMFKDYKFNRYNGPELKEYINKNFNLEYKGGFGENTEVLSYRGKD
jgi:hypothetical protein